MGSPVAPQGNKSNDAKNPIGLESFLPNSCPSGWSGSLKSPPWCPEGMAMAPVPSGCQESVSCASQLPFPRNFLQAPLPFLALPVAGVDSDFSAACHLLLGPWLPPSNKTGQNFSFPLQLPAILMALGRAPPESAKVLDFEDFTPSKGRRRRG